MSERSMRIQSANSVSYHTIVNLRFLVSGGMTSPLPVQHHRTIDGRNKYVIEVGKKHKGCKMSQFETQPSLCV